MQVRDPAVGTPAVAITCLENDLDPSRRAAAPDGPKHRMPASRTASETPATSGASGPTTTRSAPIEVASDATAGPSIRSTACSVATSPMPGLPGAACTSLTAGSLRQRERERVLAPAGADDEDLHGWTTTVCSRPGPTPTAQIFAPEIFSRART